MSLWNWPSSIGVVGVICSILTMCTGCTQFPPRIYRMDVQQGNAITPDMINALRIGMSKEQVQQIMGTPALTHSLNQNRWDYYYSFRPGNGSKTIEKHFVIFFQNNRVIQWE